MTRNSFGKPFQFFTLLPVLIVFSIPLMAACQDKPYFVTYSHDLEEPETLEFETKAALSAPDAANSYGATAFEFEYGVRAWWTAELYLDGQTTANESTLFTGYKIENRLRPLMREYPVNPLLYVEWEDISGADKTMLEVVGHDGQVDLAIPNHEAHKERKHELELKLILSSNLKAWNISENFIAEKNLGHTPWEYGYAVATARPIRTNSSSGECAFCLDKFMAGAEVYGGLGDTWAMTIANTSHYAAPLIGWRLPRDMRLSFSPGFGLTRTSLDRVYRIGFSLEFNQLSSWFHNPVGGTRAQGKIY